MSNTNLKIAKKSKNDEFYTLMEDVEKEMRYYKDFFKGKIVYCNCDDYQQSNFYKYFYHNFHYLKLKKLICTCFNADDNGLYAIYDGKTETTGKLNGDGDFRSEECIEYLKECDVVVTNPPFSLFREYVKQLMDYGKKFIIIGNNNAITYKEIFQLIKDNKIWLGLNFVKSFEKPNGDIQKFGNISWFTNVPYVYDRKPLILTKSYYDNPSAYPKFDNFDAINVDKVADIPMDYDGVMGVPITFLYKYNPTQFEIIDMSTMSGVSANYWTMINGIPKYSRVFIKKKDDLTPTTTQFEIIALGNSRENFTPNKDYIKPIKVLKDGKKVNGNAINCVLAIESKTKPINMIYYTSENVPYLIAPYARILIKKIQQG